MMNVMTTFLGHHWPRLERECEPLQRQESCGDARQIFGSGNKKDETISNCTEDSDLVCMKYDTRFTLV